jgi:hypothetical protein
LEERKGDAFVFFLLVALLPHYSAILLERVEEVKNERDVRYIYVVS